MQYHATAIKTLSMAVASICMMACSNGTSKSSSNQYTPTGEKPVTTVTKREDLNLAPVEIDKSNFVGIASVTLKAVLLTDASSSALDRSAKVSRQNTGVLGGATGVDINFEPFACEHGGSLLIAGEVFKADTSDSQAINLNNTLEWHFNTDFRQCAQGSGRLSGMIDVFFNLNFNEILNSLAYNFHSTMVVKDLYLEEATITPVMVNGTYDYQVINSDGINIRTVVSTKDTLFASGSDYQTLDYQLDKTVNTQTQQYSYSINSSYSASFLEDVFVDYQTIAPLTGGGFAYPSGGQIAVAGKSSTVYITALPNNVVKMELDMDNDTVIDDMEYSSWDKLVIDPTLRPNM